MKKILFIEDERITVRELIKKLEKNYAVDVVEDGNSALNYLNQNQYDLIFLDIMLPHGEGSRIPPDVRPKQTGIEILRKIREGETKNSPQIPVVVLTAVSDMFDIKEIKRCGPTSLLHKPKEIIVLYEAIVEAIESK